MPYFYAEQDFTNLLAQIWVSKWILKLYTFQEVREKGKIFIYWNFVEKRGEAELHA